MILKKNFFYTLVFLFVFIFSLPAVGQPETNDTQSNAGFILQLIKSGNTKKIHFFTVDYDRDYTGDWLSSISIKDNVLILKYKDKVHYWSVEEFTYIFKDNEVVKIRL